MKIVIIGPGIMPIPPKGWGAVEILIWDYKEILEKLGHSVTIINTPNPNDIINSVNKLNADFVHIQYDEFAYLEKYINCENVAVTSHFGYLDQPEKYSNYINVFNTFLNLKKAKIFCLSPSIKQIYVKNGVNLNKLHVVPNGVRCDLFNFNSECEFKEKSIYLAKIDYRKRQFLFHNIKNLYFAGNIADNRYNGNNYLGELTKDSLYKNLTKFSNLVLLSDGEAHPLVCLEAMSSGLGLVISEWASPNLNTDLPFIDVIPENKINDIDFVEKTIIENRLKSNIMRKEIREYVINNFSWENIIKNCYLPKIMI
jgi:glycosyltransferase involved in cell wall biosynthesis